MNLIPFVVINGQRLDGADELHAAGLYISVRKQAAPQGTRWQVAFSYQNSAPIILERVGLGQILKPGRKPRDWRVFLDKGTYQWVGVKRLDALGSFSRFNPLNDPLSRQSGEAERLLHRSDLQMALWDAASGEALLWGFLGQRHGCNKIDVIPNEKATDVECIEVWQEFGIEVAPGQELTLDPLIEMRGSDPYALLENFGRAVHEAQGRLFDDPPYVGYMSWYGYLTGLSESTAIKNAHLIGELCKGYPQPMRKFFIVDYGWNRNEAWGDWTVDPKKFTNGMKWLRDRFDEYGLELAIWVTLFCFHTHASNIAELLPFVALDAQGHPHLKHDWTWGDNWQIPDVEKWDVRLFDASHPQFEAFWRENLSRIVQWGANYLKLDFFALIASEPAMKKLGYGELYARTWKMMREASGDRTHLAPCSCATNIQLGFADSVRIGTDIGTAGRWPDGMEEYKLGLTTIAAQWFKQRRFWVNDPDSVQIGCGCALGEARVRATMVALAGGHLMLSEVLERLDPTRLEIFRRLLPATTLTAHPLNLFENPFPEGYPSIWALETGREDSGPSRVLAVFNLENTTQKYKITPQMLGFANVSVYLAFEWWQYRWLGCFTGEFEIEVPPGDVALIHARKVGEAPEILSVSHHPTGNFIIRDAVFDQASLELRGTIATKEGLSLVLFGICPSSWRPALTEHLRLASNTFGGWQYELVTTTTNTQFQIRFVQNQKQEMLV